MKAILLSKADGAFQCALTDLREEELVEGSVRVEIQFSSLNYKDALALTNSAPVVRAWPMVPGIDGAGLVVESRHPDFLPGDRVVWNGWGAGEVRWGCYAQNAVLEGDRLLQMPSGITPYQAMAIGTAGYTAALCVLAIERHGIAPADGDVLVTGATGGVGSIAMALLAQAGFRVVAATRKIQEAEYLKSLGASDVIDATELAMPGKPLQKERWAAAVDVAGGVTLANVCASLHYGGCVAACGMAHALDLPMTVAPFILRGVALLGIDSVMAPMSVRRSAWDRVANLNLSIVNVFARQVPLSGVADEARSMIAGTNSGRVVVAI